MYAIVEIAGQQFKVEPNKFIYTHNLKGQEAGAAIEFNQVLLVDDGSGVQVGAPTVSGATVKGKVLEHLQGDKVLIFKKKRRKGYKKLQGHRQHFTKVLIEEIVK